MNNTNTSKNIIFNAADEARYYNRQISKISEKIEKELLKLFPSLDGKNEDGTADWACDITNCEGNKEIEDVLQRITMIEKERNNTLKVNLLNNRLNQLRDEISQIEDEVNRLTENRDINTTDSD